MKIEIFNNTPTTNEIISENDLFNAIQNFSENNSNISKSLIGNKFFIMTKLNEKSIEKIDNLINSINIKIKEHENKKDILMTEIEYQIAKIKKQLI